MKRKHIILIIIAALIVLLAAGGLVLVREQNLPISQPTRINIPQGTDYAALVDSLDRHGCIVSHPTFHTLAHIRGLHKHVKRTPYASPSTNTAHLNSSANSSAQNSPLAPTACSPSCSPTTYAPTMAKPRRPS